MRKSIILGLVGMMLSTAPANSASISTAADYITSLSGLAANPDRAEKIYLRKDALGANCKVSKLPNGRYTVKDQRGYTVVITNHPTISMSHVIHGNWSSADLSANSATWVRDISTARRVSLSAFSTAKERFVNYVNQHLLIPSNPCGITTAHFQNSISKTFDAITLPDVEFFKNATTKVVSCRTKIYSRSIRQPYPQCNFTQAYQWLPEKKCNQLKNFFEKSAAVGITNQSGVTAAISPINFQVFTAAIATELAMARLPASLEANNVIEMAASPVTTLEMAPENVLQAMEYQREQIDAAYLTANPAVVAELANVHKYLTPAIADTAVQAPADHVALLTHINTLANVVTASNALPAVTINSAAYLTPRTATLSALDAQISQVHVASGLVALATPIYAVAGRCPLILPALSSVAKVQSSNL